MEGKLGVRPALNEVFRAYLDNAATLLSIAAIIFVPILLLAEIVGAGNRDTATGLMLAFSGSATFLYSGMVAPLVADGDSPGAESSIGALWRGTVPFIPVLLLSGIIYTVGTTLGTMLLVVPGLILATFWATTPAVARLEEAGPIASIQRSWRLARGTAWRVFAVVIVILLVALVISTLIPAIFLGLAGEETAIFVGSWLGLVLAMPLIGLLPVVLHRRLAAGRPPGSERLDHRPRQDEDEAGDVRPSDERIEFTDVGAADRRRDHE